MAVIDFQIDYQADSDPGVETLSGSGLGFFGETTGSSVQIGAFQDSTHVSNGDGSSTPDQANNIKYVGATFPSGQCTVNAAGTAYNVGLSGVKSRSCTFGVRFGHDTAVKVQNCQMRIFDRTNINFPASGVNTRVAEIVNFGDGHASRNHAAQGGGGVASTAVGSGDAFWWGEPWPSDLVKSTHPYYENSLGTKFYNGLETEAVVNGDTRLGELTDDDQAVGGTGIIVPLLDSPGSGQQGLAHIADASSATPGMIWPKWAQYIDSTKQATWNTSMGTMDGSTVAGQKKTFGGTGLHTHHTWSLAISASPLSIGSKEQFGLYVSLEYL
jgi:hypothetical protein